MKSGARAAWYAVQTNARAEWLAHCQLKVHGFNSLYLHSLGLVTHGRRQIAVLKPYFPRYLFVGLEPGQSLSLVTRTIGVATVVHAGDQPLEIPRAVMAELRSRGNSVGLVGTERARKMERGAQIRILQGPLGGFLATVALDDGAKIKVWLSLFGRHTTARLPASAVEPLHPNGGA